MPFKSKLKVAAWKWTEYVARGQARSLNAPQRDRKRRNGARETRTHSKKPSNERIDLMKINTSDEREVYIFSFTPTAIVQTSASVSHFDMQFYFLNYDKLAYFTSYAKVPFKSPIWCQVKAYHCRWKVDTENGNMGARRSFLNKNDRLKKIASYLAFKSKLS